jgi:hypothetical protein
VQLDHPALVLRQLRQRHGQAEEILAACGTFTRRRLVGREHAIEPGRRVLQLVLQGSFPTELA